MAGRDVDPANEVGLPLLLATNKSRASERVHLAMDLDILHACHGWLVSAHRAASYMLWVGRAEKLLRKERLSRETLREDTKLTKSRQPGCLRKSGCRKLDTRGCRLRCAVARAWLFGSLAA